MAESVIDKKKVPLLIIAIILAVLIVAGELGMAAIPSPGLPASFELKAKQAQCDEEERKECCGERLKALKECMEDVDWDAMRSHGEDNEQSVPGLGIPYLALLDILLLLEAFVFALPLMLRGRSISIAHTVTKLLLSLGVIIGGIILAIIAFVLVMLMISLLMAFPFGTIAYFAIWGFFPAGSAAGVLSAILVAKIVCGVLLFIVSPMHMKRFCFVLFLLSALLTTVIVMFLHGIVPSFLVSITDGIAAIVVAIIAIIWGIVKLIDAILGIIALVKSRVS